MKLRNLIYVLVLVAGVAFTTSCSKVLDKQPVTSIVAVNDTATSISATTAEGLIAGMYLYYKNELIEWTVFDRITNGDVIADNAYAGGDNTANITLDNFRVNSLNDNLNRDWRHAYEMIGRVNLILPQVESSKDPALTTVRRNQMLSEARFFRAFCYFDMVRLFGPSPLLLKAPDLTSSETLLKSTFVPRSSVDSVYKAILADLWFAKDNAQDVSTAATKYIISKGAVNATLAKVYAAMPTPDWDSVSYYCDRVLPSYSLVGSYSFLWDNQHKNNSEAIWEINYFGYGGSDKIGNWVPSIFVGGSIGAYQGGGWKKFTIPTNNLVNLFTAENDSIRIKNTITFLDITGQFSDVNWPSNHYPFLTKYNDPQGGTNDFYMIRLPDIMLLKAEALVKKGNIPDAMELVRQVRERAKLGAKTAGSPDEAETVIANERRLELSFEGHRWYDLLRTGKAVQVMNAQVGGNGANLNYNVQPYNVLMPVPQAQRDLNTQLSQNTGY